MIHSSKRSKIENTDEIITFPPESTTDCQIKVETVSKTFIFKVHRNFIEQNAPFLFQKFSNFSQKIAKIFPNLLSFVYFKKFSLQSPSDLSLLLIASHEYKLQDLFHICIYLFQKWLSQEYFLIEDLNFPNQNINLNQIKSLNFNNNVNNNNKHININNNNNNEDEIEKFYFKNYQKECLIILENLDEFYDILEESIFNFFIKISEIEYDTLKKLQNIFLIKKIIELKYPTIPSDLFFGILENFLKNTKFQKNQTEEIALIEILERVSNFSEPEILKLEAIFPIFKNLKFKNWISYFKRLNSEEKLIETEQQILYNFTL